MQERHTSNNLSRYVRKSKFNVDENISVLIAGASPYSITVQTSRRFARTYDVGREVGFDTTAGKQTSIVTVITEADGTLVTAFPGRC